MPRFWNGEDEAVYRILLHQPGLTQAQLAERSRRGARSLRQSVQRFADLGLVSRLAGRPTRFAAARPDAAVEVLIARRQQELASARAAAQACWPSCPPSGGTGPRRSWRSCSAGRRWPPGSSNSSRPPNTSCSCSTARRTPRIRRSPIRARATCSAAACAAAGIYAREALAIPGALDLLRQAVAAGEEARTCEDVPTKLAIADRAAAILPFTDEQTAMVDSALVVYASTLLDALVRLFELLWQTASPVLPEAPTDDPDEQLLTLLAAGLKDEAIARQLSVSLRTVHRRTSQLLDRLGARTRFQAGLRASRLGMLPPPEGDVRSRWV